MTNVFKQYRMSKGITKTQLANLLGVTPATIYRWEIKGDKPSEVNMNKLQLLNGESNGQKPSA